MVVGLQAAAGRLEKVTAEVGWEVGWEAVVSVVAGWAPRDHIQLRHPAGTVHFRHCSAGMGNTGVNRRCSNDNNHPARVGRNEAADGARVRPAAAR